MIFRFFGLAKLHVHTIPARRHAFPGHFPDIFQDCGFNAQRQQAGADTFADRMAAGLRQSQSDLFLRQGQIIEINRRRATEGQRAGFVKKRIVGLGQAFQGAAVLDHNPFAQQCACGHNLCCRHRQPERAGTCDDQHRDSDKQRLVPTRANKHPIGKGEQGEAVDRGRIIAGSPVGDAHIERAALSSFVHQPGDVRHTGIFARGGDPHNDRRGQVERSGQRQIAFASWLRFAFAGHQRAVETAGARYNHSICCEAFTGRNHHPHIRQQILGSHPAGFARICQHHRTRRALFQQGANAFPRAVPHHAVQHPPGEQEEQQHYRAVKIGMGATGCGFIYAEAGCQQYADRDRYIHIGPTMAQRHRRRSKKWTPGISDHRNGDQSREPVEQIAGHASRAGPDADREQHDIHHPETGHRERADQLVGATLSFGQRIVGENLGLETQCINLALELVVIQFRQMRYRHLFGRKIYPRRKNAGRTVQAIFNFRDTTGAANCWHGKAGHNRLRLTAADGRNRVHQISRIARISLSPTVIMIFNFQRPSGSGCTL